ncbi:amidohydrolase family protein [Arenibacter sp. GZD96]|uniref:metal-dependent hydrolase family protein n=1 Tax=Aurantibrevibacter litoralis TaxID=3106030 RepID=UPI002B000E64|nr:amidohydrolase family protein [Arenibacter sp. GZD-96]MEA1787112.1 amidohydrolase family protein [Arenibacter sp. GZD-96]
MKNLSFLFSCILILISLVTKAQEPTTTGNITLINNVQIFNGKDEKTISGNVLLVGNRISKISTTAIATDKSGTTRIIDGQGKFLMPGLIDAHAHLMCAGITQQTILTADIGFVNLVAAKTAEQTLLRGITSVRDLGGPVLGLKRAIDLGIHKGPRIWPSGAFISQTGGHGDFRLPNEIPRLSNSGPTYSERVNAAIIADNPDDVRRAAREQLMLGASQLKLMAGGGVSSVYDPLDVSQYTEAEFIAAVEAAENWGTYVTVHAYTPKAIRTAIAAGVKCIDHGQLVDEATAQLMASKGIWWSLQVFLDDEDANPKSNEDSRAKQIEVSKGTANAYTLAKKYKVKTAWGSDFLFDPSARVQQGKQMAKMARWYTPFEILKMVTKDNAELLQLAGKRSPYQGVLGVIEEGALADILLVDGNPLQDINLIADPEKNFVLIIKDGVIFKNTLK